MPAALLLGVRGDAQYDEISLEAFPGECLVLATDGVTDARDRRGQFFGSRGVAGSAMRAIGGASDDPATVVLDAAREHAGGMLIDDASVLCVRFLQGSTLNTLTVRSLRAAKQPLQKDDKERDD